MNAFRRTLALLLALLLPVTAQDPVPTRPAAYFGETLFRQTRADRKVIVAWSHGSGKAPNSEYVTLILAVETSRTYDVPVTPRDPSPRDHARP